MTAADVGSARRILLSAPDVGELEQEYVLRAMRSGWVAPAGPDLEAFENEVAARTDVSHAVGLSSGTAALHLAMVSWGVGPGDVVPVSTMTFAATANAVRYVGAEPHFVDCDERSGNIDVPLLDSAVAELRAQGRRVPVIIPVDLLGKCVDYDGVSEVARIHGARLLCDAAESFGATSGGRPAGSFGDASVLSFNGNKVMTSSGGGMLLTNDARLAAHVRKLSTQAREPVPHYEHTEIGYNYRLSNISAALGRGQLARLDDMLQRRREWRERYRAAFAGVTGVEILGGLDDAEDNCWLSAVIIDDKVSLCDVASLGTAMETADVETRPVWKPMHQQPVWRQQGASLTGAADRLFRQGLTLPSGSGMSNEDMARVLRVIEEWCAG